jgi:iron-sulfur cluster assembly protein
MMITVSDRAAEELRRTIADHKANDPTVGKIYVRVGVKGGGCSGYQWSLGLEENSSNKDVVIEQGGLEFIIDKVSALYLEGTKLDFVDELNRRGFKFDNPSVKSTCGCGSSFSL